MLYAPSEYNILKDHYALLNEGLGEPVKGYTPEKIERLKQALMSLRHYSEYYTIIDIRTQNFDWCFGLENVLGYNSGVWTHYDSIKYIHDDFRKLYLHIEEIYYNKMIYNLYSLSPMTSRYIINIPVMKNDGNFVWMKQLSIPLNLDFEGRTVKQLNTYIEVCKFDDTFLPLGPIFFEHDRQGEYSEQKIINSIINSGKLKLEYTHRKILKAYFDLDELLGHQRDKYRQGKQRVPIVHADVANHIGIPVSVVKKESSEIHKRIKEAYGVTFPNIYQIAIFFKPLFYKDEYDDRNDDRTIVNRPEEPRQKGVSYSLGSPPPRFNIRIRPNPFRAEPPSSQICAQAMLELNSLIDQIMQV